MVATELASIAATVASIGRAADAVVFSSSALSEVTVEDLRDVVAVCRRSGWPAVILLDPDDTEALLKGVRAGVRRFVSKFTAADDLTAALKISSPESSFLSPALVAPILEYVSSIPGAFSTADGVEVSKLSRREREVFSLVGRGMTNNKIAKRLSIRETTVRSHQHHILAKLDVQTKSEMIILAHQYIQAHCREDGDPSAAALDGFGPEPR